MTYQTLEESLNTTVQLSPEGLEAALSSVRSTMIAMHQQGLTSVRISLTASRVASAETVYKSLQVEKE